MNKKIVDPDLARLFENAFPNTLDTTVRWHVDGTTKPKHSKKKWDADAWKGPQSFIVTGDINAEWLRDSTNQLAQYQSLAKKDKEIHNLILGAINTQAEYVIGSPYCNAFQPPAPSNLQPTYQGDGDEVHPLYEPSFVFECKYELDSLAHFLSLANQFYNHTGSTEFITSRWETAVETLLDVLKAQSKPTFDPETGSFRRNEYSFQRHTNTGTETLSLNGIGNPLNGGTGLVRSAFRPSDDATILGFLIPSNAMISVELKRTATMLEKSGKKKLAATVREWGETIGKGVWEHGVVQHKKYGKVFAFEVDG
jgi:meiotically up-regulated gene 157 (Mug157) protein